MKEHPGVEVVSRDRSKAYAKGIAQGAPSAIQVADRFHLLQNLAEMLDQVFGSHSIVIKAVERAQSLSAIAEADARPVVPMTPPATPPKQERRATKRRERRLAVYQQVWYLRSQGWSGKTIAQELGISPTTVFRYLRSSTFPERQGRSDRGRSLLDPYKDYVLSCWNDGCHDTKKLFEEIQQAGYSGSYDTVARYTRRLRFSQGVKLRK